MDSARFEYFDPNQETLLVSLMVWTFEQMLPEQVLTVIIPRFAKHGVNMVDRASVSPGWIVIVELNDDGRAVDSVVVRLVLFRAGPSKMNLFQPRFQNTIHLNVSDIVLVVVDIFVDQRHQEATLGGVEFGSR